MSKCNHALKHPQDEDRVSCLLGLYGGQPLKSQCEECDQYSGPDRGFGDKVAKVVKATGLDKLAPKGCGCGKRRAALNKRFPKDTSDA